MEKKKELTELINELTKVLEFIDPALAEYFVILTKSKKHDFHHANGLKYKYEDIDEYGEDLIHELATTLVSHKEEVIGNFNSETKKLDHTFSIKYRNRECYRCGENTMLEFHSDYIKESECCHSYDSYSFDINVPSGKLAFCDWPDNGEQYLLPFEKEEKAKNGFININNLKGIYIESKLYADHDIIHFYVGNSSPHVLTKGNEIRIESMSYDDETDEEYFEDKTFKDNGYVCTDLWWVTAFDLDVYSNICGSEQTSDTCGSHVTIDVEPGVYRCSYDATARDEDKKLFFTIKKID